MSKQATLERRRAARLETERAAAARELRNRRLWRLAAVGRRRRRPRRRRVAVSSIGGAKPAAPATAVVPVRRRPRARRRRSATPKAPLTVTEYVDLQCPICAEAATPTLPAAGPRLRAHRQGEARGAHAALPRTRLRAAARVAAGAERQGRLWPFLEAFYARQGTENSGYVTDGVPARGRRGRGRRRRERARGRRTPPFATGRLGRADRRRRRGSASRHADADGPSRQRAASARSTRARSTRPSVSGGARSRARRDEGRRGRVALAGLGDRGLPDARALRAAARPLRDRARLRDGAAVGLRGAWRACRSRVLGLAGYVAILAALARDGEDGRTAAAVPVAGGPGLLGLAHLRRGRRAERDLHLVRRLGDLHGAALRAVGRATAAERRLGHSLPMASVGERLRDPVFWTDTSQIVKTAAAAVIAWVSPATCSASRSRSWRRGRRC